MLYLQLAAKFLQQFISAVFRLSVFLLIVGICDIALCFFTKASRNRKVETPCFVMITRKYHLEQGMI